MEKCMDRKKPAVSGRTEPERDRNEPRHDVTSAAQRYPIVHDENEKMVLKRASGRAFWNISRKLELRMA